MKSTPDRPVCLPPAKPAAAWQGLCVRVAHEGREIRRAHRGRGRERPTSHRLRRSFARETEWLENPAGVVAQIQGHKPSATAEKHDKRRPSDLLRLHHERIEAWILEHAGIEFTPFAEDKPASRLVG